MSWVLGAPGNRYYNLEYVKLVQVSEVVSGTWEVQVNYTGDPTDAFYTIASFTSDQDAREFVATVLDTIVEGPTA